MCILLTHTKTCYISKRIGTSVQHKRTVRSIISYIIRWLRPELIKPKLILGMRSVRICFGYDLIVHVGQTLGPVSTRARAKNAKLRIRWFGSHGTPGSLSSLALKRAIKFTDYCCGNDNDATNVQRLFQNCLRLHFPTNCPSLCFFFTFMMVHLRWIGQRPEATPNS